MSPKNERIELRLDSDLISKIDNWREGQNGFLSRAEAIRTLANIGLGRPEDRRFFQIARFNLLVAALTGGEKVVSHALAFAWQAGIYPLFHRSPLAEQFTEYFSVSSDKVDELSKYLDENWREKKVPSFYKIESYYDVRRGGVSHWDRISLIQTCRYFYLADMFDDELWDGLLIGSDHPTEAKMIKRNFDRNREISPD